MRDYDHGSDLTPLYQRSYHQRITGFTRAVSSVGENDMLRAAAFKGGSDVI